MNNWNSDSNLRNNTINWFNAARLNFANTILHTNQQGNEVSSANLAQRKGLREQPWIVGSRATLPLGGRTFRYRS